MEGDIEQIDDQTDQSPTQSPNLQQPAVAAQPLSYPQPNQFSEQLPPGSFPCQPHFPFTPGNFNPAAMPPLGTNPPFAQPPVSGPPPNFQAPPSSSMTMQMDQIPQESVVHPLTRPPFFMPPAPFGVRPPVGLPQHFSHPPPHLLPRPRTALPPPSAFYQDASMVNHQYNFYPLNAPPPSELNNNADLWVETSTPEGKVYYYHSKSRESSWTKPSGSGSKVVTQAEFEMMSHRPATSQPELVANNTGGSTDANSMPQQQQQQDGDNNKETESEYLTGSPPQWTLTHEQKTATPGPEVVVTPETPNSTDETPVTTAVASVANPVHQNRGQVFMPPLGMPFVDENLERMAREWSEHRNEYGRVYYYNSRSMESTWDVPPVLMEFREKQRMMLMNGMAMMPQVAMATANQAPQMSAEDEEKLKLEAKAAEEERKKKKQQEAGKPIFTRPIPATPWCMVWTKDSRIFFHNPSTGASLWDCPMDLLGRPDVQKWMSEEPPSSDPAKNDPKKLEEPAAKRQKLDVETAAPTQPLNTASSYFPSLQNAFQTGYPPGFPFGQQQQQLDQQQNSTEVAKAKQNAGEQTACDKASAEEKLHKFMELLAEKEVSAFSTWEKELPKLVFDPRYLMLPAKERKPAFEQYLRTRCDEERKEKLQKMKMKKEEFKKLLHEANMTGRWTFLDFCSKFSRDEKFKAVEKMKERESLFNEFITDLRKREKMDTKTALEQAKKDFIQLLKEKVPHALLVAGSYWQDARVYVQSDPRYRAVLDHPHQSENWYKEFCRLPSNGEGSDEGELLDEIDEQTRKARERQERVEASLRQREKVVQESLYASLMERDKERKSHMREESIQHFKALMADMVKSADVSWRDTRHALRKDARWSLAKHIEKEEKEQLFEEHLANLSKKNKTAFHRLLDETLAGSPTTTWKEIRRKIRDDPRCTKFSSHEKKREKEFDEYMVQRRAKAKQEFKDLLRETRLINRRSAELVSDSGQQLRDVIAILQKDKRYLVLDSMPEERMDILMSYINEVAKRAPSPPPTACDPRSRNPLR